MIWWSDANLYFVFVLSTSSCHFFVAVVAKCFAVFTHKLPTTSPAGLPACLSSGTGQVAYSEIFSLLFLQNSPGEIQKLHESFQTIKTGFFTCLELIGLLMTAWVQLAALDWYHRCYCWRATVAGCSFSIFSKGSVQSVASLTCTFTFCPHLKSDWIFMDGIHWSKK